MNSQGGARHYLCLTGRGESKGDDVLGKAAKRPHTPLEEKHEQGLAGQFGSMFCCSGRWKRDRERHPQMYAANASSLPSLRDTHVQ